MTFFPGSAPFKLANLLATNYPPVAILGDSITRFNSNPGVSSCIGYMTWLNILSGQQFYSPYSLNFGYSGATLAQISSMYLASVISANPAMCILQGGTNNAKNNGLASLAIMKTDMSGMIAALLRAGIATIVMTIPPDSRLTANEQLVRQAFNRWLIELGTGRADLASAAGLPTGQCPIVVDINPYLTDSTTGGWLTGYTTDGVHPSVTGAFYMGRALWNAIQTVMPDRYGAWYDYSDVYSATQNPTGALLSGHSGTLAGTTGTKTTAGTTTVTGNVATGFTVTPTAPATSTTAIVCAKQNPRTDGPNSGERQQLTFTTTVAGTDTDQYQMRQLAVGTGNVSAGDQVCAQITYQLVSCTNLTTVMLLCQEVGGFNQSFYDGYSLQQGNIPNVAHTGVLRTMPVTLSSGVTEMRFHLIFQFNTTSGTAAADMFFSDANLFKIA